ncbi:MAG TPA: ice-binding family protein [Ruminiclostridium sp.]
MKTLNKKRFISVLLVLLLIVMMVAPTMTMAAQPTVNLGTTSDFAVLAGSTITNTGTTTINGSVGGNVGLYPGTVFTGLADVSVSGAVHLADTEAIAAKDDLVIAYNDAGSRLPVNRIPTELGGTTLTPGTYDSADGTFQITGTLTLDAQGDPDGVFVFKTASTLITAADSSVNLINSARFCRTFWQVGSSATLGTNSKFVGHIFAMISITANTGAAVQGQLLARNGAVTLDSNTITNGICETTTPPTTTPTPAMLHVIKHVINDNGRTAVAGNFKLHVKASGSDVATSPGPGAESPGTTYTLAPGTYVVSEDTFAGYTASYSGDSDASGNITLASGDNKTVTITNNDTPVPIINEEEQSPVVTPAVPSENVVTTTVTGGQLPKTSSNLYELLFIGVTLMLVGAVGLRSRKRYE